MSQITEAGNPAKPTGEAGTAMLQYMNEEHNDLTVWALNRLRYEATDKILDVGCGGGATLRRLRRYVPEGKLVGVDYSSVSVALSKETNADDVVAGKTEIIEASVEALPFADNSFDKIVTVESFYFWPSPQENLREVRRVLKPGGSFLLVTEIYERADFTEEIKENIRKFNMYVPGITELTQLFRNAGFSQIILSTKDREYWAAVEGIK